MSTSALSVFKQALEKFRGGDVKRGLADLDEAIRLDPKRWEFYWTRGSFDYRRRAYKYSEIEFSTAIELCLDMNKAAKIHLKRMFCYGRLEQYGKLIEDANWLIEAGFRQREIVLWRGWGNYKRGEIMDAINDYSTVLQSAPDDFFFRIERASVYYWSKHYVEALEDVNQASENAKLITPPTMTTFYLINQFLAHIYFHLGDYEKSFDAYRGYPEELPQKPCAHLDEYIAIFGKSIERLAPLMPSRPSDRFDLIKFNDL